MKIFFTITKSEAGGAQTHVAQLARFFLLRGDAVVVMSQTGGWLEEEAHALKIPFFPNPFFANTMNPIRLFKSGMVLKRAVREFRPDIVACHSTIAGLVTRFTLHNRIPTIFTAHGWGFTQGSPLIRRLFLPTLERLAGPFCTQIICVSKNDLDLALKHRIAPPQKLTQIYNGVEIPEQTTPPHPEELKPTMTEEQKINVLFLGRLAAPKDPFSLIRAFAQLPANIQDKTRITIIGDGPDYHRLKHSINSLNLADQIELVGSLPREKVGQKLQHETDLFVLLSRWEGFPYSILEAMAAGIPVIASRVGGIPEALKYGGGVIVDSPDQLVDHLNQFILDPERRKATGNAGQKAVASHFSLEHMCRQTLAVYQTALLK